MMVTELHKTLTKNEIRKDF